MSIVEWFDPHSREHLEAWRFLSETGSWPEGFVPKVYGGEFIEFPLLWNISILHKIAERWINHVLSEKGS